MLASIEEASLEGRVKKCIEGGHAMKQRLVNGTWESTASPSVPLKTAPSKPVLVEIKMTRWLLFCLQSICSQQTTLLIPSSPPGSLALRHSRSEQLLLAGQPWIILTDSPRPHWWPNATLIKSVHISSHMQRGDISNICLQQPEGSEDQIKQQV